jgi:hypothetical protein
VQDPVLLRIHAFCDAGCEAIQTTPGCPDWEDCSLTCYVDRKMARGLGCSFEPVMDCVHEHPDVNKVVCENNSIEALDPVSCKDVFDAYKACVLAAQEQP